MLSLRAVENAVRSGDITAARKALDQLNRKGKWAKCDPARLANLLWRAGMAVRGIRHLRRTLGDITPVSLRSRPEEAAEYAACLVRVGAFREADWILSLSEVAATSMASLYRGLSLVSRWDYDRAVPAFTDFVKRSDISEYQRRVGYANLAAAYVYERRHSQATAVLRRLLHDAQLQRNSLMAGFVLEVAAANNVLAGDFKRARVLLSEADRKWKGADEYHRSLIDKWTALLALAEKRDATGVARMREQAARSGDWETLRDCEKYLALWTRNEALFLRVYFGTPYPAYRERLVRDFGEVGIPLHYRAELGPPGKKRMELRFLIDAAERKRGGLTSQCFALASLLASDLYRPHRLATLYGWLHPGEHFHPDGIAKKMNQTVRRLNAWAKENRLPIAVEEASSSYRLTATAPVTLWLPRPGETSDGWQPLVVRLEQRFGDRSFSTSDAVEALGLPRSSLVRHLQSLVVSGQLTRLGNGPASRYQLKALSRAA